MQPSAPRRVVKERTEATHRHFRIVAGRHGDNACQAIAYLGMARVAAIGGTTVAAAVSSLRAALDERCDRQRRARISGVPTSAEFREALMAIDPSRTDPALALLTQHSHRPGAVVTMSDLARFTGNDESTLKSMYGRLGRKLAGILAFSPEQEGLDRSMLPMLTFATLEELGAGRGGALRLRPEVVSAIASAGTVLEPEKAAP